MIQRTERPLTANDRLLDGAIARAHYLEQLKASEIRRMIGVLNRDVIPDLLDKVTVHVARLKSRGIDARAIHTQRFDTLLAGVRDIVDAGTSALHADLKERLVDIGQAEVRWSANSMQRVAGNAIRFDWELPNVSMIRSVITERPFDGLVLKDWFSDVSRATQKRVQRAVTNGIAAGDSLDAIVSRLRGTREARYADGAMQGTRANCEAVARTAITQTSVHAREELYRANDDVVKGVKWVSTLDLRTTFICMERDGQVYKPGEGPRPPAHFGCRSTTTPALKSYAEMGIPLKELPEGARASLDGEVPESVTYPKWLARQSAERQDAALGPARAEIYRRGNLTLDRFVDERGRELTLEQLEKLDAREAA